jgi:hypothetical protein
MYESDVLTFMAPRMSGWLSKKGQGTFAPWKRHWFILVSSPPALVRVWTNRADRVRGAVFGPIRSAGRGLPLLPQPATRGGASLYHPPRHRHGQWPLKHHDKAWASGADLGAWLTGGQGLVQGRHSSVQQLLDAHQERQDH